MHRKKYYEFLDTRFHIHISSYLCIKFDILNSENGDSDMPFNYISISMPLLGTIARLIMYLNIVSCCSFTVHKHIGTYTEEFTTFDTYASTLLWTIPEGVRIQNERRKKNRRDLAWFQAWMAMNFTMVLHNCSTIPAIVNPMRNIAISLRSAQFFSNHMEARESSSCSSFES